MAELSTLARPYAKAAFDYANEQAVINDWEDFLFVASVIVNDASFQALLDNPAITAEQKSAALVDIYDEQIATDADSALKTLLQNQTHRTQEVNNNKTSASIKNFVIQLAEQDRLALLPQIYEQYRLQREQTLQEINAYVTSAYALTSSQRALIKTRLEQTLNAKVNMHESIDPSLLAGATIKIGDKIVDDSVKGKLKQLQTQLTT
ncbi:F0F1 ATP synthase subunit delta [Psychrobacter sp. I-STPA6b]|uniref:F0F1 ATP synthase subunit delta n=1 Tax=Psychrobacter sp. I-STPA6b TaxID=2585718 RepID=UPI001D0C6E06|nr:F0F1 ATP synthase subunit delta [Psychrobacter sp. I-STPA6b]